MKLKLGGGRYLDFTIGLPNLGENKLDRWVSIVLIIIIFAGLGTIGYMFTQENVREKYTELYILGLNGQAADYPTNFTLENGQVVNVEYGSLSTVLTEQWGQLILGVVNKEGRNTNYSINIKIDDMQVGIPFQGSIVSSIGPITLTSGEKWEQEIGIIPQHIGDNQEVEIFLYKDDDPEPYSNLSLWINVK